MAEQDLIVLSENDVRILREVIAKVRGGTFKASREPVDTSLKQTPDIHIAKIPSEGIDARSGSMPGYADDCQIYRIIGDPPELQEVPGSLKRVHNLSSSDIEANTWVFLARDKSGKWWALTSEDDEDVGTGTGTGGDLAPNSCAGLNWLSEDDCVLFELTTSLGRCNAVLLFQESKGVYEDGAWVGSLSIETDTGDWAPYFYIPDGSTYLLPRAKLVKLTDSTTVWLRYEGCEDGYAYFSGGGETLCAGEYELCGDNTFRIRVSCACCVESSGTYTTPGYYCIGTWGQGAGTGSQGIGCDALDQKGCQQLTAPLDNCNVLCSGPFETLAECEEVCTEDAPPQVTFPDGCCDGDPLPGLVGLSFDHASNPFPLVPGRRGSVTLLFSEALQMWTGSADIDVSAVGVPGTDIRHISFWAACIATEDEVNFPGGWAFAMTTSCDGSFKDPLTEPSPTIFHPRPVPGNQCTRPWDNEYSFFSFDDDLSCDDAQALYVWITE